MEEEREGVKKKYIKREWWRQGVRERVEREEREGERKRERERCRD